MFNVTYAENGEVLFSGRLDASSSDDASKALAKIETSTIQSRATGGVAGVRRTSIRSE